MKIVVFIMLSFLSFSNLSASYLFGDNDRCIDDYYYQNGSLYYLRTKNQTWYKVTNNNRQAKIYSGFKYDSDTNKCTKTQYLGLSYEQYNFLYSLIGLIFGLTLFWLVPRK